VNRVTIIAEAGVNHNGDLERALKLVDAASDAGVDYVKFQTFHADEFVTETAVKAKYQTRSTRQDESQLCMLRRLELSAEDHISLINHCRDVGVRFFSTAFDLRSIDFLSELDLGLFKIPSGEITNVPYLRHVGAKRLPLILSTGMASLGEIERAIELLESSGTDRERITVLHCNTEYPTPMSDVNLRAMVTIHQAFGVKVGYSDHTEGIEVPIAAVALGAVVIEKHFTLDRTLPGPDHAASLEPGELKTMVSAIRNIEQALGDGIKRPTPSELPNREVARRSIVAAVKIRKGEILTANNLAAKRPGTGISASMWDNLIGRAAFKDFEKDELIQW
jgi:N,N'-diacetyllegionaminate synthase